MRANQAEFSVRMMCEVLGVSPSGYYAWKHRSPSARAVDNEQLLRRMREIHRFSRETYGQPRMQAELRDDGWRVNHKRVRRLMRLAGLQGATRRKKWRTTKRDRYARPAPDLIERDFSVEGRDQLWVADITYIPTSSGFLYLAVVVDAWSRRVVGWSMKTHLKTGLVLDPLNLGSTPRSPLGCDARRPVSGPRWARSVTPTTMRCARASSPRSRPSSYSGRACEIRPRLGWPFSTSSRPGTIRTGDTRHSVSCRHRRGIYRALGAGDTRRRRITSREVLMRRLLALDYVLDHPQLPWLPTEPEKMAAFEALSVERRLLPRRVYRGAAGNLRRYFPLRLPVALDAERAVFVYVDPGHETATALRSWGAAHRELWEALWDRGRGIEVVVVVRTTDERGRAETVLANWARDPHPSEFDHEIGREIDRIDRAIIKGDVRVLMEYGGLQAAMKRSVALSKRARRQAGRGLMQRTDTWRTVRLVGARFR